jgi:hypothetical protein
VRSCCGDLVSIINAGNRKIAEHSARFLKVRFLPNTRNDTTKRNPTEKGRAVRATDSMDINQCLELGKIGRILYVDCEISMISIFIFPRLAEEKRTKNGVCNHAFCMMINSPLLQQYDFEKSLPQRLLLPASPDGEVPLTRRTGGTISRLSTHHSTRYSTVQVWQ